MNKTGDIDTDILIIGAGPTGLLLANMLGKMGVKTYLVEKEDDIVREPRAVSIDDESLRALQSVGLSDVVANICVRGYGSLYRGPKGNVFVHVKPFIKEYGFDKRNAFQQHEFVDILLKATANFPNVDVMFKTELVNFEQDSNHVHAQIKSTDGKQNTIRARYMVACDGGRSSVRKNLGITMAGSTFEEPWLIIDLETTKNRCFHTEVFCWPTRSCITLPGPGGIRRYEFKLNPGETVQQAEQPDFAKKLLASVGQDMDEPIRRQQVYTFHARMAERWRDKRVFLAGDAAHLTPPFAGQGMNSGLRDAHNLAWKLQEALLTESPEQLLSSYEQERAPHAWSMITLAMRMGRVMIPSSRLDGALVRGAFHALELYKPAKEYFAQMKYKPKPRFNEGLIWPDNRSDKDTMVGRLLCQPLVETADGQSTLLDEILPDRAIVLIYSETPDTEISEAQLTKFINMGATVIGITPESIKAIQAPFKIVRDKSGLLSQAPYSNYLGHAFLLRRDRYVSATRSLKELDELNDALKQISSRGAKS